MISRQTLDGCLSRLGMLKFFPGAENVRAEIGRFLIEICPNDDEARRLTGAVLEQYPEWPGPAAIRQVHSMLKDRERAEENARKLAGARVRWTAARKEHEAACPGYEVELNGEARTVGVSRCHATFGSAPWDFWQWEFCRKRQPLDASYLQQIEHAELAARPGWTSSDEYNLKRFQAAGGRCPLPQRLNGQGGENERIA